MKFLQNRIVAVILCMLMILTSIYIGGHSSLSELKAHVESIFVLGQKSDGYGINYDLNKRLELGHNLVVVAKRYLKVNDPLIKAVDDAIDALSQAQTPSEKYDANLMLTTQCDALNLYLTSIALSSEDQDYNIEIKAGMDSHNMIIDHSPYNEAAKEFNQIISKFPTNIVSIICSIKALELYQ